VRIEKLKMLAAKGKMKAVIDWVTNFLESGEKLVLFAHHREVQYQLLDTFPDAARLIADDNINERDRQIQLFKDPAGPRLMVASIKAGGVGVDGLQEAASNVAFIEQGWTPGDMDQAEDRLHRDGQEAKESVTCWYLLAEKTIDEDIAELIDEKRVVVSALSDGDATQGEQGSIMKQLMSRIVAHETLGV
jgi:SWI/SNF-related matrix-associated actin-dependent regulator 1 of chromatin subfamily A